jgi:hypothetical protein
MTIVTKASTAGGIGIGIGIGIVSTLGHVHLLRRRLLA